MSEVKGRTKRNLILGLRIHNSIWFPTLKTKITSSLSS